MNVGNYALAVDAEGNVNLFTSFMRNIQTLRTALCTAVYCIIISV